MAKREAAAAKAAAAREKARNATYTPQIYCSNPKSKGCTGLTELNTALQQDKPASVMLAGISCHPQGTAFALLFSDGTVLAMGEALQGGEMTAEVKNGLGRFEASRSQRVKTIAATTGAFAVLMQNGSVYAWGDTTVGGELPTPEPNDCTELIAADVGFAARTAGGTVYSWGKGITLPSRLNTSAFHAASIWAERTCFAAISSTGELAVWGTSTSSAPFCNEGFAASESVPFQQVKEKLSSGVKYVRFNGRAGVAARKKGATEAAPGTWELVGWGDPEAGANPPNGLHSVAKNGVKSLHANSAAFLVVGSENLVGVWGDSSTGGGNIPLEFTHDRPVVSVIELSGSFVLIYTSGEVLVYGKAGATLYSGVLGTTSQQAVVVNLEEGTSVVRGIGGTDYFLGAIGTPCVPGSWMEWGLCNGSCFGSRKREREILYEAQNGGSCTISNIGIETCRGPEAANEECASVMTTEEEETTANTTTSLATTLSIETILGIAAAGVSEHRMQKPFAATAIGYCS
ncbi:hypothetical protein, conserved [Eimeria maxima]|uniref:Regulator of chromosome condensation domain-containing protein n=1 Tax=Eimeria maxima TaxID=5804 RepID=U6MBJ6_EIMMA|nr:hypothetical protein, conserved [Eimeria maxima]CDJ61562.1 hypothetical protein, conserved [Eimeria maxima]